MVTKRKENVSKDVVVQAENVGESSSRKKEQPIDESRDTCLPAGIAGIIKDQTTVECNDNGAEYIQARVDGTLADILKRPDGSILRTFLPTEIESTEAETGRIVFVQASFFKCGGMVLGLCFSHKITDGTTLSTVVKSWSSIALSGSKDSVKFPEFNAETSSLHPLDSNIPPSMKVTRDESVITKRYVIESSKIAQLKAKAASPMVLQPTRFEAVSALIWKCLDNVSRSTKGFPRLSVMSIYVNLRKMTVPSLPENAIGNMGGVFFPSHSTEKEIDLKDLITKLSKELKEFRKNAMETINEKKRAWMSRCGIENFGVRDDIDHFMCTSWCRFGFYEADFGWGKPAWATVPNLMIPNLVMLMDTKDGEGVEVFVTLNKEEMALFELEKELLEFAAVNPSVLN
ncbi:BAHD acyltransferase At5g47980-like [Pistacia vera]|uniref:BAHD acyltransferase At5g47980-like n=1 Tax=Pistacia vera TaxID=55513 RepID=UPI001262B32F|nr:BAHD acyltransferase At5g47980-like [Pistacia vera]